MKYRAKLKRIGRSGLWLESACPICGEQRRFYYPKYDSNCCIACDTWEDEACDDPDCPYCSIRPGTPSEALFYEEEKGQFNKDWRRQNYQHKNDGKLRHDRKRQ